MADQPFDRVVVHPRERPSSVDFNTALANMDRTLRDLWAQLIAQPPGDGSATPRVLLPWGFWGEGLKVRPGTVAGTIAVQAGLGYLLDAVDVPRDISSVRGLNDLSSLKPLFLPSDVTFTPAIVGAGLERVDIIEVRPDRYLTDNQSRDRMDPATGVFAPELVAKLLSWDQSSRATVDGTGSINYRTGTAVDTAVTFPVPVPTATAGSVKIAEIHHSAGLGAFTTGRIGDFRRILSPYGQGHASCRLRTSGGAAPFLATVSDIISPPGVTITAAGHVTDVGRCFLYLIAGRSGHDEAEGITGLTGISLTGTAVTTVAGRAGFGTGAATRVRLSAVAADANNVVDLFAAARTSPVRDVYPRGLFVGGVTQPGQMAFFFDVRFFNDAGAAAHGDAYIHLRWRHV